MSIPLQWSEKLDFGATDYTVSLWFQTSNGGTLFSKFQPIFKTFDESIKTVYVESGYLHVKLTVGNVYKILKPVNHGIWHHLAITMEQDVPSDM